MAYKIKKNLILNLEDIFIKKKSDLSSQFHSTVQFALKNYTSNVQITIMCVLAIILVATSRLMTFERQNRAERY
jgi:hypothetical protein